MTGGDTIYALSTAPGRAGIAVVRVSGPAAGAALRALAGVLPPPRRAVLARFRDALGEIIDEGLALYFPAPKSVTGEDVAELHLHGSRAVLQGVFETLAAPGAAPGRAGRVHAPRFFERQARPRCGGRACRPHRRRDRGAAAPGTASARRRARPRDRIVARAIIADASKARGGDRFSRRGSAAGTMGRGAPHSVIARGRDRRVSRRRSSRREAARGRVGRDPGSAQCRQIEPHERAGAARGRDHRGDCGNDARRDRGGARSRGLSGAARRHGGIARERAMRSKRRA